MADHSPTKPLEEKLESQGLNPYFGFPTVGKMHSLSSYTELLQYLCLMYRESYTEDRIYGGEEKIATDLRL